MILASQEWGHPAAPPVVCVHGMQTNGLMFRRLAAEFLADRRVFAVDLRGHGRSTFDPPWRVTTHAADVLETVEAAGIERAPFIGHSFGGRVVYELVAMAPDRVERLVILDSGISPRGGVNRGRLAEVSAALVPVTLDEAVASWRETVRRAPEELLRESVLDSLEPTEDGQFRWQYFPLALAASAGDAAIEPSPPGRVPTLLIRGEDSPMVSEEQLGWLREQLGDLFETVTVPGGHSILLDALPEGGAVIREFLERQSEVRGIDRSVQTDARAKPVRPEAAPSGGA